RQLGDLELQLERLLVVRDFARNRNQVSNELLEVHLFGILAGKLGVKPRRIRNIGDEPVQPAHIELDDLQKPHAAGIGPGERERFHCAAQRSERVLQLMADIRGKALDRIYAGVKRIGHLTHGYGKVADLVLPVGEVRNFLPVLHATAHAHRRRRQPPQRSGDGGGKKERQDRGHQRGNAEDAQDRLALGRDDLVDISAFRGKHEHAQHGAEALDRHRNGDDLLALFGYTHNGGRAAGKRLDHLREGGAIAARLLPIDGKILVAEEVEDKPFDALGKARLLVVHGRKLVTQDLAARIEVARVQKQVRIPVVDARAGAGRRYQPSQDGRDTLGIDREVEIVELVGRRADALAGLELEQLFRVDGDGIGFHRGRGGNGACNDLALGHQAFHARIDQPVAEGIEIEYADDQHGKAGKVEEEYSPRQAGKDVMAKEAAQRNGDLRQKRRPRQPP